MFISIPARLKCIFIPLALLHELLTQPTRCTGSCKMKRAIDLKQGDLQQAAPRVKMRFGRCQEQCRCTERARCKASSGHGAWGERVSREGDAACSVKSNERAGRW